MIYSFVYLKFDTNTNYNIVRVNPALPFKIVYSFVHHELLGYLLEAYAVQLGPSGNLTLQHQKLDARVLSEFDTGPEDNDKLLVGLCDQITQEAVYKKFNSKKISVTDFYLKIFDVTKGDKLVQDAIIDYIENVKKMIMPNLTNKLVFSMSNDGEPTHRQITIAPQPVKVLFHLMRNEEDIHYFPTMQYDGAKLNWQHEKAVLLCTQPAYMLVHNVLYGFTECIDGNKLKPFLNKKFILIPRKMEKAYLEKFVVPLVAHHNVYVKGFKIRVEDSGPTATLYMKEHKEVAQTTENLLFSITNDSDLLPINSTAVLSKEDNKQEIKILFELKFNYGQFDYLPKLQPGVTVYLEKNTEGSYTFHKVIRKATWEKNIQLKLRNGGLALQNGRILTDKITAFRWLYNFNNSDLRHEINLSEVNSQGGNTYFYGRPTINLDIKENYDWFDIYAKVQFGSYEIPFLTIRQYILRQQSEFTLPDGTIAIIPPEWFEQYADLFRFTETGRESAPLTLQKMHLALVQELRDDSLASVTISSKLEKLKDYTTIDTNPIPVGFKGTLRSYQQAGFDWMMFLNTYRLGGCLADDMGLGKTVQTLCLLLNQHQSHDMAASMLVMPTSLVYNWEIEAKKFTPSLKVLNYTGSNREKSIKNFGYYDIILTSYGTLRADIDLLSSYYFHYIILDESQAIKNPSSIIAKSVQQLKSRFKLILTGTPLENTTLDLWSQLNFVNPGLLGSTSAFKNNYLNAIEKRNDVNRLKKLHNLIKPFILRRSKSQVAKDLPPKTEAIAYCEMSAGQAEAYNAAKETYRGKMISQIEMHGMAQSQMILLQGLTHLRQIANHPAMVDDTYDSDSGKLTDVMDKLFEIIQEDHKILIFSQFVKHLSIVRNQLNEANIPYAYLDGNTRDRKQQVNYFQDNDQVKVFLISLKAGGVGLNLTAADYVFVLDPWWNPAAEAQAVDRAHRIGQNKSVFVYKFITRDTVEEKILLMQRNKQKLMSDLITQEEGFVKSLSRADIDSLFA